MKNPDHLASDRVIRAKISRRRQISLAGRGPQDDQIPEHPARRVGLNAINGLGIAAQAFTQVDQPVGPERQNRFAAPRVDLFKVVVDREDQTPVLTVLVLPVSYASGREPGKVFMDPDLFSRRRVQRHERAVPRQYIHDVIDDDRIE